MNKNDLSKELSIPCSQNYPTDDPKTFKKIFESICKTYELDNPVDQMIANRATTQLMMLQYCQGKLKEYGLFYECERDGNLMLKVNELAYYMKQVEAEFRANIRMLKQNGPVEHKENFTDWLK